MGRKRQKNTQPNGKKHLTLDERITIQTMLSNGANPFSISKELHKSPSTIVREIRNHIQITKPINDCELYPSCIKKKLCHIAYCYKQCKRCDRHNCHIKCQDYRPGHCKCVEKSPYVCNGCNHMESCGLEHRIYKAKQAQKIYEAELTDKRNGFDLTDAELIEIDRLVTPLIKQGQSPYHIIQTFGEKIPCSEATLYRLIESGAIGARNIDLHEKVKRKPRKGRKQTNKDAYARIAVNKQGRLWSDYLKYVSEHDTMTVQLDCVEGAKDDRAVLLTLHWKEVHMQLYFIMDEQTAEQVVLILDKIESALGIELFREMFPLILTDNGHEFTDIEGMEHSCIRPGENRTKVFFCEPNRSDEKGACERNHRLLRNIIPKGTSMDNYNQIQLTEVTNHVNSYKRPSLCGACPYDIAMTSFPRDFFIELGLEKIPPEEVVMSIALLHKNEDVS